MKIAVIGGVAAGTSAAAKASRENPETDIVIFEQDSDISYAGCGLPYYISGVTEGRNRVVINTPRDFSEKYGVDVRIRHRVEEIDTAQKQLIYTDLEENKTESYEYDKLIITTGASPVTPPIPGINLPGIFNLRTVGDADRIKNSLAETQVEKVSIVGGGLIGLEMAEAFKELDLEVTVIEKMPHVLPPFSAEMSHIVEKHLQEKDVKLILNDGVDHFAGNGRVKSVHTEQGKEISADLVLTALGIKPNFELAREAGIETGPTGAIKINQKMETSARDVYAAGDCAESINLVTGEPVWMPLGSTANKQGRVAGENAAGGDSKHRGVTKTAITKIFALTTARTGLGEKEVEEAGLNPVSIKIKAASHAGYYPGVEEINLKGIFAKKSGRILGAEVIGKKGVDKRIDVLSTAIYSELTANDLFQVDLAYAPPYSSPKDPVAILGMVAQKQVN
ncbi:MAG: FAD-dependent oxidoreductase [Halanaerobiaceae bacterium]